MSSLYDMNMHCAYVSIPRAGETKATLYPTMKWDGGMLLCNEVRWFTIKWDSGMLS